MGFLVGPQGGDDARSSRFVKARLRFAAAFAAAALAMLGALGGCAVGGGLADPSDAVREARPPVERAVEVAEEAPAEVGAPADAPDAGAPDASGAEAPLAGTGDAADAAAAPELVVRFLDVGQGDAALISCDGQWLLIDGGPPKASSTLYAILQRLGVTRLDCIVSTHPDADHAGGLSGALEVATCGTFYASTATSDTRTWRGVCDRLERQGVPLSIPAPGDSFDLGAARVTFLGPVRAAPDDNNNSLVLRIDHGGDSFLFTGDAEREEESDLLVAGANLCADVLKVGHHGSAGASSPAFVAAVDPQVAVISVGRNSYGHPTDEVLDRLAAQGARVLRTDQGGDIVATTRGSGIAFEQVGMIGE